MILTVTPNPSVDRTVTVPGFRAGRTNRGTVDGVEFGGKGINVARTLRQLGCDVTAVGLLPRDHADAISDALQREGVNTQFVIVPGITRVNLKLIDPIRHVETEVNEPGCEVAADALTLLSDCLTPLLPRCSAVVFSGSLPPGMAADWYVPFIRAAARLGVATVIDAAGDVLRHGLGAGPDLVKPNRSEVEELLGKRLNGNEAVLRAGRDLLAQGAGRAVISLGPEGAVSVSRNGAWHARPPAVAASNSVGAGDAMVAMLVWTLTQEVSDPEALRLATAAGAVAVGSRSRVLARSAVDRLLPRIQVEQLAGPLESVRNARRVTERVRS